MQRLNATSTQTPYFLQVGSEVYPISGNSQIGWHLVDSEMVTETVVGFRYQSVEELFFALVNLSLLQSKTPN